MTENRLRLRFCFFKPKNGSAEYAVSGKIFRLWKNFLAAERSK